MKIPLATYRLQFSQQFDFAAAAQIVDYLARLGISDIYASPILKAKKGSTHGYDTVDPHQIDPQLGGAQGFEQLRNSAGEKGLGWVQDIVPNHMAYDSENKMLMDVFENGPQSKYFPYFDMEFDHPYDNLKNKVLAPFLGEFYGNCLDSNAIQLQFNDGGFFIRYADLVFPLRVESYLTLLSGDLPLLSEQLGQGNENLLKFMEITQLVKGISSITDHQERGRQILLIKSRLWDLYSSQPIFQEYINHIVSKINGKSSEALDQLLGEQFFRLAFWKVGNEELNYRRFFTINSFVCLRMNNYEVFDDTHQLIVQMANEGKFTGLRIDHIDGLYDPAAYIKNLRQKIDGTYLIVEKILDLHEDLPLQDLQGTTGYDFLNFANELFVDSRNEKKMDRSFALFTDRKISYDKLIFAKKQLFIGRYMAGDVDNLAHLLKRLLNGSRYGKDLTMYALRRALVEVMAQFPVYRTYIEGEQIQDIDKVHIKEAMASARNNNPGAVYELDVLEKILLLNFNPDVKPEERVRWLHFIKRFQQFTGPLVAKALEDTAFYIYNRLVSLNEVGGNPSVFGIQIKNFHEFNEKRLQHSPHTLNATSTHDTKRGEDMRCRLDVLSEIPQEWMGMVRAWSKINRPKIKFLKNGRVPDKDDEYFIYQTLLGAFPLEDPQMADFSERVQKYIVKAIREAKIHTGWIKPDVEYETACMEFIKSLLTPGDQNKFLPSFLEFEKKIAALGIFNSLSQVVLKLTSPGVADFYQGTELWDLNLVDPDNRRPVDYQLRKASLDHIQSRLNNRLELIGDLWAHKDNGQIKLFLIHGLLSARREFKDIFQNGAYVPLQVTGPLENNIIAFGRHSEGRYVISAVTRFLTQVFKDNVFSPAAFKGTAIVLPQNWPNQWRNVITGETGGLSVDILFNTLPVAVLANV